MPNVITLAHQKGGVGKTTLALNLCAAFQNIAQRSVVVDADVQGSITDLVKLLAEKPDWQGVSVIEPPKDFSTLRTLEGYDYVFVDTPPYLAADLPAIFDASDFILVPTKASPLDALAIRSTLALIRDAQQRNPRLQAAIVMNMAVNNASNLAEIRNTLETYEFDIFSTILYNRVAYGDSLMKGSVFASSDTKARAEIVSLATELIQTMAEN